VRVRAYRDVALEALVFGDPASARDFARAELGPLAEDSQRAAVLRETLRAYFDAGSSTREAARSLRIAERTVTYRLRRAEALIGRVLSERRAELEAAVRLHCVLDIAA
jgi:DNA-binding PucR family transcriptional regulator